MNEDSCSWKLYDLLSIVPVLGAEVDMAWTLNDERQEWSRATGQECRWRRPQYSGRLVLSLGYALPGIILKPGPSGYDPNEDPRLIAYTWFIGIWRPHFLAYMEFRMRIFQIFYRTESIGLCDFE